MIKKNHSKLSLSSKGGVKRAKGILNLLAFSLGVFLLLCLGQYMMGYSFDKVVVRQALSTLLIMSLIASLVNKKAWLIYPALLWVVAFGYGFVGLTYGMVDRNAIAAFMFTDWHETKDFVQTIPVKVVWFYVAYVGLTGVLLYARRRVNFSLIKNWGFRLIALVLLIAIAFSTVIRLKAKGQEVYWNQVLLMELSITRDIYDAYDAFKRFSTERSVLNRKHQWKLEPLTTTEPSCDVCVVVMGESVRRDMMHAYGAPWSNTPWMDKAKGTLFTNMNSASCATAPSLSVELYAFEHRGEAPWANNVVTLAQKAGYHTTWISNQNRRGVHDSPISVASSYADEKVFLRESASMKSYSHFRDEASIPFVKEALVRPGKLFIFVHLWGSHPRACGLTNDQYDEFFESDQLSCYLKTIRTTDAVLSEIEATLKTDPHHRKWDLLYTADHGLGFTKSIEGWELVHKDDEQQAFEVPLFITSSEASERKVVEAERSGRYFTHIVANWLGYKAWTNEESQKITCHFLKDEPCEDQNLVRSYYHEFKDKYLLPSRSLQEFQAERKAEKQ